MGKKKAVQPGDIPLGSGMINKAATSIKNKRLQEAKQLLNLGAITETEYEKIKKRLGVN
tara:strand:+ start:872 stop:1048 length:177 start_codon:yes stop_codon:yes gene_type:complete